MVSQTQPMPYSYYPSSGSVARAGRPAPDEGRGSFGPVLVVLAVISFLTVAACIAGRLCGRRSSSGGKSSAEQQRSSDAEKGFGVKHPTAVMRPLPSSRATGHDVDFDDDVFEIKFAPVKPAGWEKGGIGGGGGISRVQALPQPQLGLPRQYAAAAAAAAAEAAGFRCAPANGGTGAVRQVVPAHPPTRGTGASLSFTPAKHSR